MRRRIVFVAATALSVLATSDAPAFAHGLGGRVDLPVPRWLFVYGAATAVIVSFVALAVVWREPRLQDAAGGRRLPAWARGIGRSTAVEWIVRGASLAVFGVVLVAALGGSPSTANNFAPVLVYVWFWVGLPFLHAIFGNWWATLSPWDTIARLIDWDAAGRREYPRVLGKWPAAILLLGFTWMELVDPLGAEPRSLGAAILVYTAITLAGMWAFGRDAWNENGEAFAVYFALLSRIAPLSRDEEGYVVLRPVLGGLPSLRPQPGLVAFIVVLLGSTTFDGFSRASVWTSNVGALQTVPRVLVSTAGLLVVVGLVGLAYALAMLTAGAVADTRSHPLAVRFVHSLMPIAFAYVVAHYFSLLLIEGQNGVRLLSDPFGRGWDLLGTAEMSVNLALISATFVWYVQVAAIVAGHIGGVVLAHDRAIASFRPRVALRTQYALLSVMVLFTVVGLLVLSGG